jgi:hypothetical protein
MRTKDRGPMSIYDADKRRKGFAEQFRRLEEEWPAIVGPQPSSDQTPAWLSFVRPFDVRGTNLLVVCNNPKESVRILAATEAIIAAAHSLGLVCMLTH